MQSRRSKLALAVLGAVCASTLALGPAVAQPQKQAKMKIVGATTMKPGKWIRDDQRFTPHKRTVRSGATVRLADKSRMGEPHTLSVVRKSDLARNAQEAFNCEVCNSIFEAHGANEETGDIANPVVNVGAEGFDQPGDSIFVAPKSTVRFDVTAAAGRTLYFMCAIHPWMQGRFKVK